jgi:predicted DNA-binding transcriptional regulator YafY
MDRFDRIYALHRILSAARVPVSRNRIEQELECSRATVKRIIESMRLYLGAPIEYDKSRNGYYYAPTAGKYELPGLWFKPDELLALVTAQQLLSDIQPGLLDPHLAPLRGRIEQILDKNHLGYGEAGKRIRIIGVARRTSDDTHFATVATALLRRKQLLIEYRGRAKSEFSTRAVSPQRMVHYRDRWYLDAWCHLRNDLRSFSLDCITKAQAQEAHAHTISDIELNAHFTESYGIFAGPPTATAVLHFTSTIARWVADEHWHPKQSGRTLPDGRYELSIPYGDPRELIMDILKYGPDVEVVAPQELRIAVAERVAAATRLYSTKVDGGLTD